MKKSVILSASLATLSASAVATVPQMAEAQSSVRRLPRAPGQTSNPYTGDFGGVSYQDLWNYFSRFLAHLIAGGKPGDFDQPIVPDAVELPSAFALTGDCNLRSPCHLDQDGKNFKMTCRPSSRSPYQFEGMIKGRNGKRITFDALSFDREGNPQPNPFRCNGRLTRSGWQGTCQNLATPEEPNPSDERCAFEFNESPAPVVYAEQLPPHVDGFSGCGVSYTDCEAIQDGTSARLRCKDDAGEDALFTAYIRGNGLRMDFEGADGNRYRCTADYNNEPTTGTCTQRLPRGSQDTPLTCDDFSFNAQPDENPHGECSNSLPAGFKLQGCGLDDTCQVTQRGCEWQISCGDQIMSGRSNGRNYTFINAAGQRCTLRSDRNGVVSGTCATRGSAERCLIRQVETAPVDESQCFKMPSKLTTGGCGLFAECNVIQDGCMVQANCRHGEFGFNADVSATGIAFEGLAGFSCAADLVEEDGKKRLVGDCSRANDDGTVRTCREFFGEGQAALQMDWEQ